MSMNIPNTEAMSANRELKGKHVLTGFLLFFGVIIAVNFTMARLASTTWTRLVVKNSYVASQKFKSELTPFLHKIIFQNSYDKSI